MMLQVMSFSCLDILLMGPDALAEQALSSFHSELASAAKDSVGDVRFQAISTIKKASKQCYQYSKKYVAEFMPSLIATVQEAPNIKVILKYAAFD